MKDLIFSKVLSVVWTILLTLVVFFLGMAAHFALVLTNPEMLQLLNDLAKVLNQ